jgi:hypothetical protein
VSQQEDSVQFSNDKAKEETRSNDSNEDNETSSEALALKYESISDGTETKLNKDPVPDTTTEHAKLLQNSETTVAAPCFPDKRDIDKVEVIDNNTKEAEDFIESNETVANNAMKKSDDEIDVEIPQELPQEVRILETEGEKSKKSLKKKKNRSNKNKKSESESEREHQNKKIPCEVPWLTLLRDLPAEGEVCLPENQILVHDLQTVKEFESMFIRSLSRLIEVARHPLASLVESFFPEIAFPQHVVHSDEFYDDSCGRGYEGPCFVWSGWNDCYACRASKASTETVALVVSKSCSESATWVCIRC